MNICRKNTIKKFISKLLIEKIGAYLSIISPQLNTQYSYFLFRRNFLNLSNPKTFSEKLSWLKLNRYNNDEIVKICSDKLAVRQYVKENGLEYMLNKIIAVYEKPEDILWDKLPDKFVLKWNFGSGYNYICQSKDALDIPYVIKKLNNWKKSKFWLFFSELQYKVNKKYILCEKFLESEDNKLLDYKFYCFHGVVRAILVIDRYENNNNKAAFMSDDWTYMGSIDYKYRESFIPKRPKSLEDMIKASEMLSKLFPFVRVDFYESRGNPIFGEMTFTPAAGLIPSEILINGKSMGDYIDLGSVNIGENNKKL